MASLHLAEPYRSALLSLAYSEGLVTAVPPEAALESDMLRAGADVGLQRQVMQALTLFDDVTILWRDLDQGSLTMASLVSLLLVCGD